MRALAFFLSLLPKNILSFLTGYVARLELPKPFSTFSCRVFAAAFGLKMDEAENSAIDSYKSIEDVFIRRLKAGARTITGPVCSPADGFLARSEPAENGSAVQAKGLTYSIRELVFGAEASPASAPKFAWYTTIYLAPPNYHRVHAPVSAKLSQVRYFPGELWPVNGPFVRTLPRLFVRNERVVFDLELVGGGKVHAVMVGALNVGRMQVSVLPDFVSNSQMRLGKADSAVFAFDPAKEVSIGDEIGVFMLGSTVILVFDELAAQHFSFVQTTGNQPIMMGQPLAAPR